MDSLAKSGRILGLVCLLFALFVGAASPSYAVDCVATPDDPACVASPTPTPSPTTTEPPLSTTPTVVSLEPSQFALLGGAAGLLVMLTTASLVSSWGGRRG